MFLHIGNNINVPIKNIVAILNEDALDISKVNSKRIYMENVKNEGSVKNDNVKNKRSYIIVCPNDYNRGKKDDKECIIYLSNISSTTLLKRCEEKTDWR
ncbi:hypothetical protein [Tepidimicrobium xylanilyticum]